MSIPAEQVPDWTLGWRLQRALDWAGVSVQQMADELDVSRGTISRWCNDHGTPRSIYLRAWAIKCRVPLDWLSGHTGTDAARSSHRPRHLELDLDRPTTQELASSLRKQLHGDRRGALNRRADPNPERVTA